MSQTCTEDLVVGHFKALEASHMNAGLLWFFTDVEHLRSIGIWNGLYCRTMARALNLIVHDGAAGRILQRTPEWVHNYVRLYFAPRTPMLYDTEGIKRVRDDWPECPRPVYLVFRPIVVALEGCLISDGNMASEETRWEEASAAWLDQLPYWQIFHRGPTGSNRAIVRRRHAEVLVPSHLPLEHLAGLFFRSQAEEKLAVTVGGRWVKEARRIVNINAFYADERQRPYPETSNTGKRVGFKVEFKHLRSGDWVVWATKKGGRVEFRMSERRAAGQWGPWGPCPRAREEWEPRDDNVSQLRLLGHLVAQKPLE